MSLYQQFDMQYCDRCRGERPHSKRGRCLATHRTAQLATVTALTPRRPPAKLARKAAAPKPRRTYNQDTVRAVIAALLSGTTTLQQGCREIGCDPKYLHKRARKAAKEAVAARDGNTCQWPGREPVECSGVLDVQHRIGRGSGGSSNPLVVYYLPNLLQLCRGHHTHITTNPLVGYTLGLAIPRIIHDPSHVLAETINGLVLLTPDGGRTLVAPPDQEAS